MPEQVAVFGGAGGVGHAGAGLPGRSIGDRGGGGEMYVQHSTRVAEGKRAGLSSRSIGDRGGWGDKI